MQGIQRFHSRHGKHICLIDQTVALRQTGFSDGVCFSEKPISPMEPLLIEIMAQEKVSLIGHLRIGLTQFNPGDSDFDIPSCALPDLTKMKQKKSWIYAVPESTKNTFNTNCRQNLIRGTEEILCTYQGPCHWADFEPYQQLERLEPLDSNTETCPTDVGSRIGIIYYAVGDVAEMCFILNGTVCGPIATGIPYKTSPLYAVVDVYGKTKQVQIIQLRCVPNLTTICREIILNQVSRDCINLLPLPTKLQDFLRFGIL